MKLTKKEKGKIIDHDADGCLTELRVELVNGKVRIYCTDCDGDIAAEPGIKENE